MISRICFMSAKFGQGWFPITGPSKEEWMTGKKETFFEPFGHA